MSSTHVKSQGVVVQACNLSASGGGDRRIPGMLSSVDVLQVMKEICFSLTHIVLDKRAPSIWHSQAVSAVVSTTDNALSPAK